MVWPNNLFEVDSCRVVSSSPCIIFVALHIIHIQGQHYPIPQAESTSRGEAPDDLHQIVYIEVKPHSVNESEDQNIDCTSDSAGNTIYDSTDSSSIVLSRMYMYSPHSYSF